MQKTKQTNNLPRHTPKLPTYCHRCKTQANMSPPLGMFPTLIYLDNGKIFQTNADRCVYLLWGDRSRRDLPKQAQIDASIYYGKIDLGEIFTTPKFIFAVGVCPTPPFLQFLRNSSPKLVPAPS